MNHHKIVLSAVLALMFAGLPGMAGAKLPVATPEQAAAKVEKKTKADAQADQDKQNLLASMDGVNKRWRSNAAAKGWHTNPATPVVAPLQAVAAPVKKAPADAVK